MESGLNVAASSIAITVIIAFLVGLIGYVLARILTMSRSLPRKHLRYEAGNPPTGRARGLFMMQYYAYLIVYLTVEPVIIYLLTISLGLHSSWAWSSLIFSLIVLSLIPPLVFGLWSARRVELWKIEE